MPSFLRKDWAAFNQIQLVPRQIFDMDAISSPSIPTTPIKILPPPPKLPSTIPLDRTSSPISLSPDMAPHTAVEPPLSSETTHPLVATSQGNELIYSVSSNKMQEH